MTEADAGALGGLGAAWQRFWARAPRRLRATTAGRLLLALSVACGLLALNSGNNLLFFVWGLQLGAVVLSGLLSEACLRPLRLTARLPSEARVGHPAYLTLQLHNASRIWPVYAVQLSARLREAAGTTSVAHAPYLLRLSAGARAQHHAPWVPTRRGALKVANLVAQTAYPFGLFVKDRRFAGPAAQGFVWPAQVPAEALAEALAKLVGEAAAARPGGGDDLFALRAFRPGDAPARVLWRRAAGGRPLVVREQEATQGAQVALRLVLAPALLGAPAPRLGFDTLGEYTVAVAASLAEALAANGWQVGLSTHGTAVPLADATGPAGADRRRRRLLDAFAQLDLQGPLAPLPAPSPAQGVRTVALVGLAAVADGAWPTLDLAHGNGAAP